MSDLRELKSRLASIKQTGKITNAMYLLSSSRLRKCLGPAQSSAEYDRALSGLMNRIASCCGKTQAALPYSEAKGGKPLVIAVMGDRGLCGDYNSSVAGKCAEYLKNNDNSVLWSAGTASCAALAKHCYAPSRVFEGFSTRPSSDDAANIASLLTEGFSAGEYCSVDFVYTPYKNGGSASVVRRLLPVGANADNGPEEQSEMIFEPSHEAVLKKITEQYILSSVLTILLSAAATENSARLTAMRSATDNADGMIKELESLINTLRQEQITSELTELAAAQID